ncbi:hypothetical protein [Anatilimnocola floriformis]|uniref:hypothetical protein n=1 Tax=Anatilimnocola floriformis TaxID=2948575 RepID=UPI0020C29173|nr:hypothetical protein [Anatilimnocola floriformis]
MTIPIRAPAKPLPLNTGKFINWRIVALAAGGALCAAIAGEALPVLAQPADRKSVQKITAALIDFNRSPAVALLEAQLLASNLATWVERTEVTRILDEKKLQTLFAADSGGERAKLGKMLKADVLVLVRSGVAEKVPYVEIVVSEVSRGLRLVRRRLPLGADVGQDVAELLKIVEQGFTLQSQPIQAIYAVPPFVSEDLEPDYDELKTAFSLLVEQRMLEHPGVVVVELAEAEALQRELLIAGDDVGIKRQLPTYLLGQYRNEGKDAERTINIKLTLQQGEKQLGTNQQTMKPAEASTFLRERIGNVVASLTGKEVPPGNARQEAAQLARRSKEFSKLGLWEDALTLIQASLLLDPKQPDMHHDAVVANANIAARYKIFALDGVGEAKISLGYYLRGLDHQLAFYYTGGDASRYAVNRSIRHNTINSLHMKQIRLDMHELYSPQLREYLLSVLARSRKVMLELYHWHLERGDDRAAADALHYASRDVNTAGSYALLRQEILALADEPRTAKRTVLFALFHLASQENREGQEHLKLLEAQGNEHVRAGVATLRKEWADFDKLKNTTRYESDKVLAPVPAGGKRVRFEPITLHIANPLEPLYPTQHVTDTLNNALGFRAIKPGLDLLWSETDVFVMREKGILKRIWSFPPYKEAVLPTRGSTGSNVCYDGRYIWVTVNESQNYPRVLVIDATTDKVHEITHADGLPGLKSDDYGTRREQPITLVPLEPGRVCAAGGFGRSWIGTIAFSAKTGPKIRIFHEAKTQVDPTNRTQWRDTQVAFLPTYMLLLETPATASEPAQRRICLGRRAELSTVGDHCLMIDPDGEQVTVLESELGIKFQTLNYCQHAGAIYFLRSIPHDLSRTQMYRLTLPGPRVEPVREVENNGFLVEDGESLHFVGSQWFIGGWETKLQQPAGLLPWWYGGALDRRGRLPVRAPGSFDLHVIAKSSNYGWFVQYGAEGKFFHKQVIFDTEPSTESVTKDLQ